MYETAFEIVALGMRYVFIALILYILLRLVLHAVREFRAMQEVKHQVRSVSPGYLEATAPEQLRGEKYALRRENTIGRSKRSDIFIDLPSLAPIHAFLYEKKDGLYIADYGSKAGVLLNGEAIKRREELLYSGDALTMADLSVVVHLAGEEEEDEDAV